MIGSYAYTDGLTTEDPVLAGKLQNVAVNTRSLYLVYDFHDALPGRLRIGAGAPYVRRPPRKRSRQHLRAARLHGRRRLCQLWATYDTASQKLPVTYQLNVKNMFNTVYYPSAVSNLIIAVGDARRVSASATIKF